MFGAREFITRVYKMEGREMDEDLSIQRFDEIHSRLKITENRMNQMPLKISQDCSNSDAWNRDFANLLVETLEGYYAPSVFNMPTDHPWIDDFLQTDGVDIGSPSMSGSFEAWNKDSITMITILDEFYHYLWATVLFHGIGMNIGRKLGLTQPRKQDIIEYIRRESGPATEAAVTSWLRMNGKDGKDEKLDSVVFWHSSAQRLNYFTRRLSGKSTQDPYENLDELWELVMHHHMLRGGLVWELWQENRKLLQQARLFEEQLKGIKLAGACMSYRHALEKQIPRKPKADKKTTAWSRNWTQKFDGAVLTKTGPLWKFVKSFLHPDPTTHSISLDRMRIEGEQIYARTSRYIHEFDGINPVWHELGPEWSPFEAGLLRFYKLQDLQVHLKGDLQGDVRDQS